MAVSMSGFLASDALREALFAAEALKLAEEALYSAQRNVMLAEQAVTEPARNVEERRAEAERAMGKLASFLRPFDV